MAKEPIKRLLGLALGGIVTVAGACASGSVADDDQAHTPGPLSQIQLGENIFTEETFDGNDRVCSTCHELDQFGTITPEFVQELFERDPTAPLFRSIDSDDGRGDSYERLKQHATVRVPFELVTHEATGLSIRKCSDPAADSIVLNRGNPTVFNVALEQHLMVDGREQDDLETQAKNAILTHNEPGRDGTTEELAAMAAFQRSLFSHEAIRAFFEDSTSLELPAGNTPSEIRGRAFFAPDRECGICHGGPLLNRTSERHPFAVGFGFESSFVGREPDNPNEKFDWCYVDPTTNTVVSGPEGDTLVYTLGPVADPGLPLIPGATTFTLPDGTVDTMSNEILGPQIGPAFKIPTLWGVPNTAPYFHDNSAKTLDDVLDQYNFLFSFDLEGFEFLCNGNPARCLSEQDREDIINFLQLLAFEDMAMVRHRR